MPNPKSNPVLKTVHGVKVRKYNYPSVLYNEDAYIELINQAHETGLSIPVLIALKSQPCQICKCDNVTLTIAKDGRVNKQDTSQNIIERNRK